MGGHPQENAVAPGGCSRAAPRRVSGGYPGPGQGAVKWWLGLRRAPEGAGRCQGGRQGPRRRRARGPPSGGRSSRRALERAVACSPRGREASEQRPGRGAAAHRCGPSARPTGSPRGPKHPRARTSGSRPYPRVGGQFQEVQFLFGSMKRVVANDALPQVHQHLSLRMHGAPLDLRQTGGGLG